MQKPITVYLPRVLIWLAGGLVLKVTATVLWNYRRYFPPDFESDFLQGRESYFFGSYQWAFYLHLLAGPTSLLVGMLLLSDRFRIRYPRWHRRLGRVQAVTVLVGVTPSGLWMAYRAEAGPVAGVGFALLALVTALTVALGWRSAVKRRFAVHRLWMLRCYLLLCSTVVLRLSVGLVVVSGVQAVWFERFIAWGSWILPLAIFELVRFVGETGRVRSIIGDSFPAVNRDQRPASFHRGVDRKIPDSRISKRHMK